MIEPIIPPEDNARYALLLADYVQPINASRGEPVPTCHFTAMEFHECDSDPSGRNDGYQCRHCGHTEGAIKTPLFWLPSTVAPRPQLDDVAASLRQRTQTPESLGQK